MRPGPPVVAPCGCDEAVRLGRANITLGDICVGHGVRDVRPAPPRVAAEALGFLHVQPQGGPAVGRAARGAPHVGQVQHQAALPDGRAFVGQGGGGITVRRGRVVGVGHAGLLRCGLAQGPSSAGFELPEPRSSLQM